ncbi:MAG: glutathione S-transferase family protein [Gammaproteobacteria bacterium TMED92]|nr:MAG: glutathione S-transferase family protein [Gammaproteobacteria bacterium TMED92]
MKLYNSMGPNPHVVRMFAAECGVGLELEEVDLMGGANRQSDYLSINPAGQLPCLVMTNGDMLAEVTAICEYLDECADGTSLLGESAEERASVRMWTRRVDLNICEPLTNGFRYSEGLGLFKDRMITIPEAADGLKQIAREKTAWLNTLMADGRDFIAGDKISLADVLLYCFLAFAGAVGQPYDQNLTHIHAWFERMAARPSAQA